MNTLMKEYFPNCPICKEKVDFSTIDEKKYLVQCTHCNAVWKQFISKRNNQLISLKLIKIGQENHAKSLDKKHKVLGFWLSPEIFQNNASIEKNTKKYFKKIVQISFNKEKSLQKLIDLGDLAVFHLLGVVVGIVPSLRHPTYRTKALDVLEDISNPICLPDLLRILNASYQDNQRQTVLRTIIEIIRKSETKDYKEFLLNIWREDPDRNLRGLAISVLRTMLTQNEFNELIPEILRRIRNYEDVSLRINSILGLSEFTNNPLVIRFLLETLPDKTTPPPDLIMAGSLESFLVAAAKSKPKPSVGEVAANILLKSGNEAGIIGVVDYLLSGGFGRKIQPGKIQELINAGPFVIDHLKKIFNEETNSKNITQKIIAKELLSETNRMH